MSISARCISKRIAGSKSIHISKSENDCHLVLHRDLQQFILLPAVNGDHFSTQLSIESSVKHYCWISANMIAKKKKTSLYVLIWCPREVFFFPFLLDSLSLNSKKMYFSPLYFLSLPLHIWWCSHSEMLATPRMGYILGNAYSFHP